VQIQNQINNPNNDILFDRNVDDITTGLQPYHNRYLKTQASADTALIICNYI